MNIFEVQRQNINTVASTIYRDIATKGGTITAFVPAITPKVEKILQGKEYYIAKYDDKTYILVGTQTNLAYFVILTTNPDDLKNFNLDNPKLPSEIKSKYPVKAYNPADFYNTYSSIGQMTTMATTEQKEQKPDKKDEDKKDNKIFIFVIASVVILIAIVLALAFMRKK
jgi:hypothetical protein